MKLKELYLYPDLVEYTDDVICPFRDQSRSICNFLERRLQSIMYKTEGFKKICIIGKSNPCGDCIINSSNALSVEIEFDQNQYKKLGEQELNPYFSDLLKLGFLKCHKQHEIPLHELMKRLEEFQAEGYKNEWRFKSKRFKELGVTCFLNCRLTLKNFELALSVLDGDTTLFDEVILTTEPDEIVFVPMFKDIGLSNNHLIVSDRSDKPIFELDYNRLDSA